MRFVLELTHVQHTHTVALHFKVDRKTGCGLTQNSYELLGLMSAIVISVFQDILESVVLNSASFRERTKFSQEKYRRKKEKKWVGLPLACDCHMTWLSMFAHGFSSDTFL